MIDSRLNIPDFEADFEAVVDSIRQTGTITGLVTLNGTTTIQTVNSLKLNDVITVGGVSCKVLSSSSSEIVVNKEVDGLDWKAEFPYFMDGHLLEIIKRLKELDESNDNVLKWSKYPLVILLQDIDYSIDEYKKTHAKIDVLIVNQTNPDYFTEQRRINNFATVLDPIHNKLMNAIENSTTMDMSDNRSFSRKYYWGSKLANENPFNDYLDAIEIGNINLELSTKC